MILRKKNKAGYILIYEPNHPFAVKGYVPEHRLVCEKKIGRYLTKKEVIHHLDCNRENNKISNLMLFSSQAKHKSFENKVKQLGCTRPILRQINERWNDEKIVA